LCGTALGLTCARRRTDAPSQAAPRIAIGAMALLWIVAGFAIVLPIVIAESKAQASDEALRHSNPRLAAELARSAYDALPFSNSDYLYRAARALPRDEQRATLREAIRVNPTAARYYRMLADIEKRSASPDVSALREAFEAALELDPNDVGAHLDYAESLEKLGLKAEAREQYRVALEKNDRLAPDEPKRLPQNEVDQLKARIESLSATAR